MSGLRRCPQGHVIAGKNAYIGHDGYPRCRACKNEASRLRRAERALGIPAVEHYRPLSRVEVERRRSELLAAVSDSWLRSLVRDNKP